MTGPSTGLVAGPVDFSAKVAGMRRVFRGVDPDEVAALLKALEAQIRQLQKAYETAVDGQQRATDKLREWQSEHTPCCQLPVARPPSRAIIGQSAPTSHQNPPYHSSRESAGGIR